MTMLSAHLRAEEPDPATPTHWRGLPPAEAARLLRQRDARHRLEDYREARALDHLIVAAGCAQDDTLPEEDEDAVLAD